MSYRARVAAVLTRARVWGLMHVRRTVVIDTETTDLQGQICELSIIDAHGKTLLDTLVRPCCPISAGAGAVPRPHRRRSH